MKNIIFIDVDGTLVGQDGSVPSSARKAIEKAHQAGHEMIICTGRSMGEITDEIRSLNPDGYIAAGGSYIKYKNEVIQHIKFDEEDIKEITQFLSEKDIAYYLETNSGLFASENCIEKIKEATEITLRKNPERFIDSNNPYPKWFFDILNESRGKEIPLNEINKLSFINTEHPFIMIKDKFQDRFEVYESTVFEFGDKSGEIGLKGLDKQDGIEKLLKKIKGPYRTYAYGDGLNDISMFKAVDKSIAMENAHPRLKAYADEITQTAEQNGLSNNFKKNGLF